MKLNTIEDVMVFQHEYNGRKYYSIGISSKKYVDGHTTDERVTAYLNVQFPKQNAPIDKQKINITKSFFAAYEGNDGKPGLKLVVQEWEPCEENNSYLWG